MGEHHLNGFRHLGRDLQGMEDRFDVGYKFIVEDPPGNHAGPYLSLYFSVCPRGRDDTIVHPRSVSYRFVLHREEWTDITQVDPADEEKLMERSLPAVIKKLQRRPPS